MTVKGKIIDKDGGFTEYPKAVSVVSVRPTGTIIISPDATADGADYARLQKVTLKLAATDPLPGSGVSQMRFRNYGQSTWSAWQPYSTSKTDWYLTAGDGPKTVYAQYKDGKGNLSNTTIQDTIKLDTVKPGGTIRISGGAVYAKSTSVSLTLSATDPSPASGLYQMRFRNENTTTWSGWQAYGTSKAWTLSSANGTKTVYVQLKDRAGNIGGASDTIKLDTVKPSGSIKINSGATSTRSRTVSLALSATDPSPASGVYQMRFRNENTTTWSGWVAYSTSKSWTLSSGGGAKKVYAQYKDRAGHMSSQVYDSITYTP